MRAHGMQGVVRGKKFITTKPDGSAPRPPDLVQRDFTASRPNELWIVDFTYVPTWAGMGFTAFVKDVYTPDRVGQTQPSADAQGGREEEPREHQGGVPVVGAVEGRQLGQAEQDAVGHRGIGGAPPGV